MRSIVLILLFCLLSYFELSSVQDRKYALALRTVASRLDVSRLKPLLPAMNKEEIDTAELKKTDWYAQITKDIEEQEYAIKTGKDADTYASPNRKQGIHASYAVNKLMLQPLTDSVDKWKLVLSLRGIYSGKQAIYKPSADPAIEQKEGSIRFHTKDEFTVEYINSPEGVRENFIIQKNPAGNPDQVSVELKANNGWFINKVHDKEIHFAKDHNGRIDKKITYNSLKAWGCFQ